MIVYIEDEIGEYVYLRYVNWRS